MSASVASRQHGAGNVSGGLRGFLQGLSFALRGLSYVYLRNPAMLKYWLAPVLATALGFAAAVWLAMRWGGQLVKRVWPTLDPDLWWHAPLRWLEPVANWLVSLSLLLVLILLIHHGVRVLLFPFNDRLSNAVERGETGRDEPPTTLARLLHDLRTTLLILSLQLGVFALVLGPLWMLSWFIPVVATAYPFCAFAIAAWFAALDYTDWPAARRDWGLRARLALFKRRRAPMLGFGAGVASLFLVPCVGLFLVPGAVAGGTLLFVQLEAEEDDGRQGEADPALTKGG